MDRANSRIVFVLAAALAFVCGTTACQAPPRPVPVAVSKITPSSAQRVVDQVVLVIDASGSIDEDEQFPQLRALVQSLVASMPDGDYEVAAVSFGGVDQQIHGPQNFNREMFATFVEEIDYQSDGTPLDTIFEQIAARLEGKTSRVAVVVMTDGLPSDVIGRDIPPERAIAAARAMQSAYNGDVCIHTVQVGTDAEGAAFLRELSDTSSCGSSRTASSLASASAIEGFGSEALLMAVPVPVVVPAPAQEAVATAIVVVIDADRDGVPNADDACPGTPRGASVDERGCWVIPRLRFDLSSAGFGDEAKETLNNEIVPVLEQNPNLRVRIDGHTDSSGDASFNRGLSERRASAVRDYLISRGIDGSRIETKGFGEEEPIAPNKTAAGRTANRRTEITVLD